MQVVLDEETAVHKVSRRPFVPLPLSLFLSLSFSLSLRAPAALNFCRLNSPFRLRRLRRLVVRHLESYAIYIRHPVLQRSGSRIELISRLDFFFFFSFIRILFYTGAICEPSSNNSLVICICMSSHFSHIQKCTRHKGTLSSRLTRLPISKENVREGESIFFILNIPCHAAVRGEKSISIRDSQRYIIYNKNIQLKYITKILMYIFEYVTLL